MRCPCCELFAASLPANSHSGIRSASRTKVLGYQVEPLNPLTAYSVNVSREKLAADPDLKFFLNRSGFWSGPYSGVNHMDMPDFRDSCNFCFTIEKDGGSAGEWYKQCDVDQVRRQYAAFEPRIHKILDLASEAPYIWKLSDIPALETWRSSGSRVVLLGDAAHAMLPYAAMVSPIFASADASHIARLSPVDRERPAA